ncbi:hypothetical protein ACFOD9_13095, partial [Novosphingobium bradum]
VTVTDEHGASVTRDITITVTGTNDAPEIVASTNAGATVQATTDVTGAVTEDSGPATLTDSGVIAFHDVDYQDLHTASFTRTGGTAHGTFALDASVTEGDYEQDGSIGWTYAIDNA